MSIGRGAAAYLTAGAGGDTSSSHALMRDRSGGHGSRLGQVVAVLIVIAAAGLVGLHVRAYTQISPIDELQHVDYLQKASRGQVVARGERVGGVAMREEACRGIDAPVVIPPCDAARLRPEQFQEAGYNTAYIHPPTYYGVSGILARFGQALPGLDGLVAAGRLTGAIWLAAAVALLWLAMGDLGVGLLARAVLLVVLASSPTVLHASATVNPDAMALLAGAGLLLALLRWEAGRWPAFVPWVVAAAAILVKSTNVVAVGAAILYVVARHAQVQWSDRHRTDGTTEVARAAGGTTSRTAVRADSLRLVGGVIGAVALASVAWVAVQGAIAEVPNGDIPMVQRFEVDSISLGDIRGELGAGISPLQAPYLPEVLRSSVILSAVTVVDAALLAGLAIAAVYARAGSRRPALAVASLLAMAASGPLFVIINFAFVGTFVQIPSRYGLSVIPFALAAVSVALERRALLVATAAYAGWLLVITAVPLIQA